METAVGAASWLLDKTLAKLSDELVATFVASSELGHNFQSIKRRLLLTQGLLHAAQDRDLSNNSGLYGLLGELSKKADEAEDVLDEIHYFMIQDQLDGTSEAAIEEPAPLMGDIIRGHLHHVRHAFRHNIGNWLPYFSCSPTQHDDHASRKRRKTNTSSPNDETNSGSPNDGGHFHSSKELHSNIPEVGKMKFLQELKEFHVKKESVGFELRELGELAELGGKLRVCNLETMSSKGEANTAKLKNKKNLKELELIWSTEHQTINDDVLDGLQPHPNLRVLGIINPGVAPCPRWLCGESSTKKLEALHLEGLSWVTLPPFEKLPHLTSLTLNNIIGMRVFGPGFRGVTERSLMHLKTIEFKDMPQLVEWVGDPNGHMISRLESIKFGGCPLLRSFPYLECSGRFTNLCRLHIYDCPELAQFPPMPHTSALTDLIVANAMSLLSYDGKEFSIEGYNSALAFRNMDKVEVMKIKEVSHISMPDLQKLISLRSIQFERCDDLFSVELDDIVSLHSVQSLEIRKLCITGEVFSKVLKCFPALSQLTITKCKSLELLPLEGGGLSGLRILQSLKIWSCGKIFSRWPKGEVGGGAHAIKPFPTSLRELNIFFEPSMQSMGLLSNLTSLSSLSLESCEELTMDGFNLHIIVNLKKLTVNDAYFGQKDIPIARDLLSEIARSKLMHAGSFRLKEFEVDCSSAVLTAPICSHLAATLHRLTFCRDQRTTIFTEEQEQALQLLISLQHLEFRACVNLRSLPQGLHGLPSLKRLVIFSCYKVLCLPPKEGLPTSLETLEVKYCSPELTEQAKKLEGTDPWFSVEVSVMPAL